MHHFKNTVRLFLLIWNDTYLINITKFQSMSSYKDSNAVLLTSKSLYEFQNRDMLRSAISCTLKYMAFSQKSFITVIVRIASL